MEKMLVSSIFQLGSCCCQHVTAPSADLQSQHSCCCCSEQKAVVRIYSTSQPSASKAQLAQYDCCHHSSTSPSCRTRPHPLCTIWAWRLRASLCHRCGLAVSFLAVRGGGGATGPRQSPCQRG